MAALCGLGMVAHYKFCYCVHVVKQSLLARSDMNIRLLPISITALILGGCATSNAIYAPPEEKKVENSTVVNGDFDTVWDQLVKKLSADFFVINNIEKASRLINLSFSTNTPSDFIDCGESTRTLKNLRGEDKVFYKSADSVQFNTTNNMGALVKVNRTTRLEGRTNIYVAPDSSKTNISVNTKYVLTVTMQAIDIYDRPVGTEVKSYDFSTTQPMKQDQVMCVSNGKIEQKIIDFAR